MKNLQKTKVEKMFDRSAIYSSTSIYWRIILRFIERKITHILLFKVTKLKNKIPVIMLKDV